MLQFLEIEKKNFCSWLLAFTLLLFSAAGQAQTTRQAPSQAAPQSTPATEERRISPEEAESLLRSVDEVLEFNSQNTGLRIREKVKRSLAGREQVQEYIQTRIREDEDAERLRNAASVLKKFGLLPRDFQLESFLVELMGEQVAGYYDTRTKTVYLLNWLSPEVQQPVMAHELMHALQDQNYGIEEWVRKAQVRNQGAEKQVASDEALAARHAVVEGQAMAVMVDYLLSPIQGSLVKSPLMSRAIQEGMLQGADSPVLARTPLYIRQLLLFPYGYGLNFIRELLVQKGTQGAYVEVFKNPPLNTRQIMQPKTYLAGETLAPPRIPEFDSLVGTAYQPFDVGSVGEFDVSVIVQQFAAPKESPDRAEWKAPSMRPVAQRIDPRPELQADPEANAPPPLWTHWRGGFYYAARRKSGNSRPAATTEVAPSDLALVYVSRWDTAESAAEFARVYASSVEKRYTGSVRSTDSAGGCGGCTVNAGSFETNEGPVSIEVHGNVVLALEGFDLQVGNKLRTAVLKANPTKP